MAKYWLFKTEPDVFSIEDLSKRPNQTEGWDGVRNYQARNFMRDDMQIGDEVLIYHSSCKHVGIAGRARVAKTGLVDPTQFDQESPYYDPKSTQESPRWIMVAVQWLETFQDVLSLKTIKRMSEINHLALVKKGHRLSIMPIVPEEYSALLNAVKRISPKG